MVAGDLARLSRDDLRRRVATATGWDLDDLCHWLIFAADDVAPGYTTSDALTWAAVDAVRARPDRLGGGEGWEVELAEDAQGGSTPWRAAFRRRRERAGRARRRPPLVVGVGAGRNEALLRAACLVAVEGMRGVGEAGVAVVSPRRGKGR